MSKRARRQPDKLTYSGSSRLADDYPDGADEENGEDISSPQQGSLDDDYADEGGASPSSNLRTADEDPYPNSDDFYTTAPPPRKKARRTASARSLIKSIQIRRRQRNADVDGSVDGEDEGGGGQMNVENITLEPRVLGLNLDHLIHGTNKRVVTYILDEVDEDAEDPELRRRCRTVTRTREDVFGEDQGSLGCFACGNVGESSVAIRDTNFQILINILYDFDTTDIDQHCVNVTDTYETLIRQPANKHAKPGDTLLPPWHPATVKAHLLYHSNDMGIAVKLMISKLKSTAIYMVNNQVLKATVFPSITGQFTNPNEDGTIGTNGNVWIDKAALKGVNDTINNLIKLAKLNTRQLVPGSIRSNALMALNANKTSVIDPTKKKIISTGNYSQSLDRYFQKDQLTLRNGGAYLPASATGPGANDDNNEQTEADNLIDLVNDGDQEGAEPDPDGAASGGANQTQSKKRKEIASTLGGGKAQRIRAF